MKFQGCLLAVKDMVKSRQFYEEVMKQPVMMDAGKHVGYGGFSLQQGYDKLIGIQADSILQRSHNFQVYFEVEDLDTVYKRLKELPELKWVHEIKEYPWGQRDIRVYDPDMHIVEIAEDMNMVIKRFLDQGMTVEQAAERSMYPIEAVKAVKQSM